MILTTPATVTNGCRLEPVEAAVPTVQFSGNGDMEAVTPLEYFLSQLHTELVSEKHRTVEVDLTELYFMNSSCLKQFVSWIHKVDTGNKAYRIQFVTNPRLHWQSRSLATLKRLAPTTVTIRERAAEG